MKGGKGEFRGSCYKCGGWGHSARFCTNKGKGKEERKETQDSGHNGEEKEISSGNQEDSSGNQEDKDSGKEMEGKEE